MIIEETIGNVIHHHSDGGYKIRQIETGIVYDEAYDLIPCAYTYEETDEPIYPPYTPEESQPSDPDEISAREALEIITGGAL